MKSLAAVLAFACFAAAAAPAAPPPQAATDLRRALEQYDGASGTAPRRLTTVERAELRRQLSEQAKPAAPLPQIKTIKQRKEP